MRVTLNKGSVHSVSIQGDFAGTPINLELSASEACWLLQELGRKRAELRDMAENYYDCKDCGQTHHIRQKPCPNNRLPDPKD